MSQNRHTLKTAWICGDVSGVMGVFIRWYAGLVLRNSRLLLLEKSERSQMFVVCITAQTDMSLLEMSLLETDALTHTFKLQSLETPKHLEPGLRRCVLWEAISVSNL